MTNDVTAPMFAAVLLGQPRYFYTAELRNPVVNIHRIVRDGANRLWLSTQYGGVPVEEASVTVLGPVPEYSNLPDERGTCPHDGPTALVHRDYHNAVVAKLEAEIARLKGETYCAYCGERFPLDAPDATERIGRHIEACPRHPMRAVEAERDAALAEGHRLKARVIDLEAENRKCCVHCAPLRARVAELEALNEHLDEESGQRDCAALEAEVDRLKAHTWEQERAAVVAFIVANCTHGWGWMKAKIERGGHWPEGGTP